MVAGPVADPYKVLGLTHEASQDDIKRAYRKLAMKLHPDRLTRMNASPEEMQEATAKFAQVSAAYSLLTDEQRKREYDHIYKFGGYDDLIETTAQKPPLAPYRSRSFGSKPPNKRESRSKGIGYAISDPLAFILTGGKMRSTTVAGIQIPSRFNISPNSPDGGFRVAFSNGHIQESPSGTMTYVSKNTQFVRGKKFSRVETVTVHKDGRKEVVIEGDDYIERRVQAAPKGGKRQPQKDDDLTHSEETPWYINTWYSLRDNLQMCSNPCGAISVR